VDVDGGANGTGARISWSDGIVGTYPAASGSKHDPVLALGR